MSAITGRRQWQIDCTLNHLRWTLGMRQPTFRDHYVIDDLEIQANYAGWFGCDRGQPTIDYALVPQCQWLANGGLRVYWYMWCSEDDQDDYYRNYGDDALPVGYCR